MIMNINSISNNRFNNSKYRTYSKKTICMAIIYISIFTELSTKKIGLVNSNIIKALEHMHQNSKLKKREPRASQHQHKRGKKTKSKGM